MVLRHDVKYVSAEIDVNTIRDTPLAHSSVGTSFIVYGDVDMIMCNRYRRISLDILTDCVLRYFFSYEPFLTICVFSDCHFSFSILSVASLIFVLIFQPDLSNMFGSDVVFNYAYEVYHVPFELCFLRKPSGLRQ